MGLLGDLVKQRYAQQYQEADTKLAAYRSVLDSQETTPQAKEYALSQVLNTAQIKGKEQAPVAHLLRGLLGIGKGGAQPQAGQPPQTAGAPAQPQSPEEQPIPGGGPMVPSDQPQQPATPQIQPMPKRGEAATEQPPQPGQRPQRMFMTPEEIGQRNLNIEKPELDYKNAQQTNLENLKEEHQNKLKELEFKHSEAIESSKEFSKLAAAQAAAGKLTGKQREQWDTAKALVSKAGGDPNDTAQVQEKLNGLLADKAKMDHDKEAEGILRTQAAIGTALYKLSQSKQEGAGAGGDVDEISQGIMNGDQPPDLVGMARGGLAAKIRANLERKGFNLAHAQMDWQATKRALSTMNSTQQVRMRQALDSLGNMLPNVEQAYDEWTKTKLPGGFKLYNKVALQAAANGSGPSAAVAQNLLTLINDSIAETGYVYMGGNSPTDHALKLAQTNLSANWNPTTFKTAMHTLKQNLQIRQNSINNVHIAGASESNPYTPQQPQSAAPAANDGAPSKDPLGILK